MYSNCIEDVSYLDLNGIIWELILVSHCKPKPCKAHRELPVSQFPLGITCFHYRDFPVNPCTSLLGIAVRENPVFITGMGLQWNYRIALNYEILFWGGVGAVCGSCGVAGNCKCTLQALQRGKPLCDEVFLTRRFFCQLWNNQSQIVKCKIR